MTRGDRNRNRKIGALRGVVARDRAVLAVDLGEDKQAAVLIDHEGRALARKVVRAKAYQLGGLLGWAAERAVRAGFAGLVAASAFFFENMLPTSLLLNALAAELRMLPPTLLPAALLTAVPAAELAAPAAEFVAAVPAA